MSSEPGSTPRARTPAGRADADRTGSGRAGSDRAGSRQAGSDRATALAAYFMLFLFGLLQGLVGSFQYSRGPASLVAVAFDLLIAATCIAGAWGMGTPGGGLLPGAGWLICTFVLAAGTSGGSILITNTTPGQVFLFGGAAATAGGCLIAYLRWSRAGLSRAGRPGG